MNVNPTTGRVERTAEEKARHHRLREVMQFDRRPTQQEVISRFDDLQKAEQLRDQVHRLVHSLREERLHRGMPLEELASRTGWDQSLIAQLEDGELAVISFDILVEWARAFGKKLQLELVDAA